MVQDMEITNKLVDYILEIKEKDFPKEIVHQFKRALMDYICATISGSRMPVVNSLLDYIEENDKNPACTVIGHPSKLSSLNAALVNGTSAHSLDFDDGHTQGSIHIGGVVFPAVFAIAEQYNSTPKEIINAVIIGYEIAGRLSASLHPNTWKRGYHNTPVIGIFGATAAVATLLNLSKEQILDALGHAGSFSGGLLAFLGEGADTKRFHAGKAARDSILSVEMAKRGITGPKKVFEGKNGFIQSFADNQINIERLLLKLNSEYEIEKIYFKPYPCCRHLHGPIEAVKHLMTKNTINIDEIKKIYIGTYKVGSQHNHKQVEHLLDAQMSIPCAISLALIYGDVTLETFKPEKVNTDIVKKLMDKVNVIVDEKCENLYPKQRPSIVTIKFNDRRELKHFVEEPKGEGRFPLTDTELENKFRNNVHGMISNQELEEIIQTIWDFDQIATVPTFLEKVGFYVCYSEN